MTINELYEELKRFMFSGALKLRQNDLKSEAINRLLENHFWKKGEGEKATSELLIANCKLELQKDKIDISGAGKLYRGEDFVVKGHFYIKAEQIHVELNYSKKKHFIFKGFETLKSDPYQELFLNDINFRLFSEQETKLQESVISATYELPDWMKPLLFLLRGTTELKLNGRCNMVQHYPQMELNSQLFESIKIGDLELNINLALVSKRIILGAKTKRYLAKPQLEFVSFVTFETASGSKKVAIGASLPFGTVGLIEFKSKLDKVTLSDIANLVKLVGGGLSVPEEIPVAKEIELTELSFVLAPREKKICTIAVCVSSARPWTIIEKQFTVDKVGLQFLIQNPFEKSRKVYLSGFGTLRVAEDILLDFSLTWPDKMIRASLNPGSVLPFRKIAAVFLNINPDQLPDLNVIQLNLLLDLKSLDFQFSTRVMNNWPVKIGEVEVNLNEISFEISRESQKIGGGFNAIWDIGGVEIMIGAAYPQENKGWIFSGGLYGDSKLELLPLVERLAKILGTSLPENLPKVNLTELFLEINTADKSFDFKIGTQLKMDVPLGNGMREVNARVALQSYLDDDGKRKFEGNFEGDILLENSRLTLAFNFGTISTVKCMWAGEPDKTLQPKEIAKLIGIHDLPDIPEGLDIGLTQISFEYHVTNKYFTLSAKSLKLGDAFMTAGRAKEGGFGLVFGINAPPSSKLSQLPGIGQYLTAADFITVKQAAIIVATAEFKDYVIPSLPEVVTWVPNEDSVTGYELQRSEVQMVGTDTKLQLKRGLSLALVVDFAAEGKEEMKHLRQIIGETELTVQLTFNINPMAIDLFIGLKGMLTIPLGEKEQLKMGDASMEIEIKPAAVIFKLMGLVKVVAYEKAITARAILVVSTAQIQVSLNIEGENVSLIPPGFTSIRLNEIGMALGVFFQPPSFGFGITGKYQLGSPVIKQDSFGIMLEVIQTVPNVKYLSFYVGEIDIETIYRVFLPEVKNEENFLNQLKGRDISFYMCQGTIVLPDGTTAAPGLGFSGTFRLFDFGFQGIFQVKTDTGISGNATCSPLNLRDILRITGDGQDVIEKQAFINGQWRRIDNSTVLPMQPPPQLREIVLIEKGGPIMRLSTSESPYVKINWNVSLFNVINQKVDVLLANEGMKFSLGFAVQGVTDFKLDCVVQNWTSFRAEQSFVFAIDEKIGPVKIGAINLGSFHLKISISNHILIVLNSSIFSLDLNGKFEFQGISFTIPQVSLSVAPKDLSNIANDLLNQLKLEASKVFDPITKEMNKYLDMVKKGIVTEVENMARVLKEVYKQTAEEAARILKDLQYTAEQIARYLREVYTLVNKQILDILSGLAYSVNEIAVAVKNALQMAYAEFVNLMMGRQVDLAAICIALVQVYQVGVNELIVHLRAIGAAIEHIVSILGQTLRYEARTVIKQLMDAGLIPEIFTKFITTVLNIDMNTVLTYLRDLGVGLDQLVRVLHQSYNVSVETIIRSLMALNYDIFNIVLSIQQQIESDLLNIIRALRAIGIDLTVIADILKRLGQDFFQIINLLRQVVDLSLQVVWDILKALGAGFWEIVDIIRRIFGAYASEIFTEATNRGHAAEEIIPVLHTLYELNAADSLEMLKQQKTETDRMVRIVADVYGTSKEKMGVYLKQLQLGKKEMDEVLNKVYANGSS